MTYLLIKKDMASREYHHVFLKSIVSALVLRPKLLIILTGDPDDIYFRKKEISISSIKSLSAKYTSLLSYQFSDLPIHLDTSKYTLDECLYIINTLVAASVK